MQKKLIAVAVAGILSGTAYAQSNVTVYGRLDYGFDARKGADGAIDKAQQKTRQEFRDGIEGGSRIGFKGAEDLGNGTKAIFEAEFGIGSDAPSFKADGTSAANQAASSAFWTNRHSYIGLTGNWGTFVGGRLDGVRYNIYLGADQLVGGVGNITQMTAQVDRADNAFAYISPNFNGFTFTYAHSLNIGDAFGGVEGQSLVNNDKTAAGAKVGNKGDIVLNTFMLKYANGPITAWGDYEYLDYKSIGNSTAKTWLLAGTYDFGMVKVGALYDSLKGDPASFIGNYDKRTWLLSAKVPYGAWNFKGTYGHIKDKKKADADVDKWGFGIDYNLSKRTQVFTNYGHISNDSKGAYVINASPNARGAGYGNKGIDFGISHNF